MLLYISTYYCCVSRLHLGYQSTLLCNLWGKKRRAPSKLRAEPSASSCWKRSADLRRRDSIGGLKSTWYWYRTHWGRERMRKKFADNWIAEPVVPEEAHTQGQSHLQSTPPTRNVAFTKLGQRKLLKNDKPDFDSLTCSIACLVLTPSSWKSRRRPPLSPSFTCWNPAEICRTANEDK